MFWIKKLAKAFGCSVQIHKFVGPDDPGCFHSHPAYAVRIVFRGGYVEETKAGEMIARKPLYVGVIRPEFEHRIDRLLNGSESWSLWLRGPRIAKINYGCDP